MLFGFFWGDWTIIILIPAMIFAFFAQSRVQSTFKQYAKVASRRGITGAEAARRVLDAAGLYQVRIEQVSGHLTDHYDPRDNVIRLSNSVYGSTGIAAIGVAAHEAGHACQHAEAYLPIKVRAAIIPLTRFGSALAMPLFIIGMLSAASSALGDVFMLAGILFFSFSTLFQLVTLPTEFNASARAMRVLEEGGVLTADELPGARKTLSAAALTYVAALAASIASLLRLILIFNGRRD
ncbi:MAG: zinc metallopeptidase [Clostridia bacterium]|nr:zinc metallopeptidase [Clostridia bacterium]